MTLALTDEQRAHLTEMRALTTDEQGREVLVGLTHAETVFYLEYGRRRIAGERSTKDRERYLELHEQHERARQQILGAEIQRRSENPPLH